jgi:hypothetical protein
MTCQGVEDGSQFEAVSKAGFWSVRKGGKNAEKCEELTRGPRCSYAPTSITRLFLALQTNSRSLQGKMNEGKPWKLLDSLAPLVLLIQSQTSV